jgi:tetratricopeptide (TPR) repeat protein
MVGDEDDGSVFDRLGSMLSDKFGSLIPIWIIDRPETLTIIDCRPTFTMFLTAAGCLILAVSFVLVFFRIDTMDSFGLWAIGIPAAYAYAKTGQRDKALAMLQRWKEAERTKYVMNYLVAISYAGLGDKDAAFTELEKAYQNHDWFLQRLNVDPFMDPLRGDPRFDDMVKRLKYPN